MSIFFKRLNTKRRGEMQAAANKLGMNYFEEDNEGIYEKLRDFKLFQKGRFRKINNVMKLNDDEMSLSTHIFDYRYTKGSGNSSKTYKQTVFFISSNDLALPELDLKPEHFFHKIVTYLGMQDIDFEEFPVFSNQYLLKGEDEDLVRQAFDDKILRFFTIEKNYHLEGLNYYMIFYRKNKQLQCKDILKFYRTGMRLFKLFKT